MPPAVICVYSYLEDQQAFTPALTLEDNAMGMRWLIGVLVSGVAFLPACGPLTIKSEDTGSYVPARRGALELHQDVVVPPGRARVFFQAGRVVSGGINEFKPHCELTVKTLMDEPQTIHADTFSVDRVSRNIQQVVRSERVLLASLLDFQLANGDGGNGESMQMHVYIMKLHSAEQPQVQYLVCGGAFDEPALARGPTLQDIAAALGTFGTLELR